MLTTPLLGLTLTAACATIPDERDERAELVGEARNTVDAMAKKDPGLPGALEEAAGYIVFPRAGEGAFIVGATAASGVVYEDGEVIGFSGLRSASIGAQVGAQSFDQLIVFRTKEALRQLKTGDFSLSADASATALASGATVSVLSENDVGVIVDDEEGALAEASVGGQTLEFEARR